MVDEARQSDIVDKAFDALRASQPPQGPSLQALEQTLQAVHQAQRKSDRIPLVERIFSMNKFIKYPIAAAITLAVIAGGAYLLLGHGAGITFADVRREIEQTQTMTLTATAQVKGMDKPVAMKMFFKFPGLMRQEMMFNVSDFLPAGSSRPASMPADQEVISIFDMAGMKGLTLIPGLKKATPYELRNLPAEEIAKAKEQNLLDKLKQAVAGKHEELGEKTIKGQKAKGYRCRSAEMQQMTMDIWVDAQTGKPLLVEEAISQPVDIKATMTDFVLDPKLEDSLFDIKAPEGYAAEPTQTLDYNIKEEDLVKGLGTLAKFCGGTFPKSLILTPDLIKELQDKQQKKPSLSEAESKEFATQYPKLLVFQMTTMQGGEFIYAAEGVKLGDKATPILWYKAKDAKKYRVIYGDLHAEDADTAPKRPATQPATESR
jgi:outer membrane lipoprotein-sorting protein